MSWKIVPSTAGPDLTPHRRDPRTSKEDPEPTNSLRVNNFCFHTDRFGVGPEEVLVDTPSRTLERKIVEGEGGDLSRLSPVLVPLKRR